jgi:hypothetical protein
MTLPAIRIHPILILIHRSILRRFRGGSSNDEDPSKNRTFVSHCDYKGGKKRKDGHFIVTADITVLSVADDDNENILRAHQYEIILLSTGKLYGRNGAGKRKDGGVRTTAE